MKPSRRQRTKRDFVDKAALAPKPSLSRKDVALLAVMVAMVVVAFSPAFNAGWIWDDDEYVTENHLLPARDGLWRIWFTMDSPSQYFPLVYTMFRIEHSIWRLHPTGYHTVNILMHAANALLIWLLLARLAIPGAWLAAAIWALHPVQVESVAWVTERKNVLSTFFYVLCLLNWNAFLDRPDRSRRHYALAVLTCALALFAKTTAATIPAVLLIVAWWKRRPIDRTRILQVVPFLVISFLMGLLTMWWEKVHQGTSGEMFHFTPVERLLIMSRAAWFYLEKLILPRQLAFSYPKWDINPSDPIQYLPVVALIAAVVVLWLKRGAARGLVGAGLFFFLVAAPMLGIFSMWTFRYTYVADHYQYLACLGPITWFAVTLSRLRSAVWQKSIAAAVLALLCALSFSYSRVYKDSETLWLDVIAKNPGSYMAYNNLGRVYWGRGERDRGIELVKKAIEVCPTNAEAHFNLGIWLASKKKLNEAISELELAIKYLPQYAHAHRQLSIMLARKGRMDEAIEHGELAAKYEPRNPLAYITLGSAQALVGRTQEAADSFREAVRLAPGMAQTHLSLALTLTEMGQVDEAITEYQTALQIDSSLGQAHANLAVMLFHKQDYEGAWGHVYEARKLGQPVHPDFLRALSAAMPDPGGWQPPD